MIYLGCILLRVLLATAALYCGVSSIHYAILANVNFGIISCCFIVSIVINCTFAYFFFSERMTLRMILGILVTISGIIWISLSKAMLAKTLEDNGKQMTDDEL